MDEIIEKKEQGISQQLNADGLFKRLVRGKLSYDAFAKKFDDEYLIEGKTADEWREIFSIKIPPDCNISTCIDLNSKIMKLHQRATHHKAKAENRTQACKGIGDSWYRTEMVRQVAYYREISQRMPSKDTMAAIAESSMEELLDSQIHANIVLSFWKDILADIREARKVIENISMNLSVEAKALQHEQQINSLAKKFTNGKNHQPEEYPND